jgi:hypothetical protein
MAETKSIQHRYFKDEYGFLLEKSRPWTDDPDDGRGDAIGRTVLAGIVYGDADFIGAFQTCVTINGYGFFAMRHPEIADRADMSRDHIMWWVLGLRYFNPAGLWKALEVPWRISKKFRLTIDLWLWIRAVAYRDSVFTAIYWLAISPVHWVYLKAIQLSIRVGGFKSVPYTEFKATPVSGLTKRQKWGRKIMQICPSYTVHQIAWMLTCLPDGWMKRRMQERVIKMAEEKNWVTRSLCGEFIKGFERFEVDAYKGMDALRWGRRLDESTDIDMYALKGRQKPYNLSKDMLDYTVQKRHLNWLNR